MGDDMFLFRGSSFLASAAFPGDVENGVTVVIRVPGSHPGKCDYNTHFSPV
jgi:hypothetical protein